ncbi:MAG: SDR family NAD(P)-dependent oxidoreductase, partial [Pseudomonadota bacterium]
DGKTVLITGAASGIGRASVIRAAQEGANVIGVDISESGLESLRSDVEGQGGTFAYVAGSVEDLGVIDASIRMAVDQFGGLDCLVNNAGISGDLNRFDQFEVADFERMVAINQRSVWYGIKAAYAPMQERGGGSIVNVASMAGIRSNRNHCLYGMTKAAVISLTHHAAMDYASAKIRVNCLCPGPVETPMFDPLKDIFDEPGYRVARQRIQDRTVMDRFGAPEEQAAAIAFLLSEEASFITGIAMPVDGGWSVSDGQRR